MTASVRQPQPVWTDRPLYTQVNKRVLRGGSGQFGHVPVKEENQVESDGSMVLRTDGRREMVAPDSWERDLYGKSL